MTKWRQNKKGLHFHCNLSGDSQWGLGQAKCMRGTMYDSSERRAEKNDRTRPDGGCSWTNFKANNAVIDRRPIGLGLLLWYIIRPVRVLVGCDYVMTSVVFTRISMARPLVFFFPGGWQEGTPSEDAIMRLITVWKLLHRRGREAFHKSSSFTQRRGGDSGGARIFSSKGRS